MKLSLTTTERDTVYVCVQCMEEIVIALMVNTVKLSTIVNGHTTI